MKRLTRLLCDKIEKVDPGFGIEIMRLAATAAEPFATKQMISSLIDEPDADVSGLIDILSNRVGESRLTVSHPLRATFPNGPSSGSPPRRPPPAADGRPIGPALPGS